MHGSALKKVNSKHLWSRDHGMYSSVIQPTELHYLCFLSFLPQRVEIEASEWGEGGPEKGKFNHILS